MEIVYAKAHHFTGKFLPDRWIYALCIGHNVKGLISSISAFRRVRPFRATSSVILSAEALR